MSEKQTAHAITTDGKIIWRTVRYAEADAWQAFTRKTINKKTLDGFRSEGYVCSRIQASIVEGECSTD